MRQRTSPWVVLTLGIAAWGAAGCGGDPVVGLWIWEGRSVTETFDLDRRGGGDWSYVSSGTAGTPVNGEGNVVWEVDADAAYRLLVFCTSWVVGEGTTTKDVECGGPAGIFDCVVTADDTLDCVNGPSETEFQRGR
ncbi:MAG: hypothetical protein KTR31_26625 [Myxococcales bacterium]|nr:hypothetical protein [Myxococcales bacterium]